jgi:hypothetical protein
MLGLLGPAPSGRCRVTAIPTVRAYSSPDGTTWRVWCPFCRVWHIHGPDEGLRVAHCDDKSTPYARSGYRLVYAGPWNDDVRARHPKPLTPKQRARRLALLDA